MMKLGLILVSLLLSMVLWVRLAKDDPAIWHVDPLQVEWVPSSNRYLLRPDRPKTQSPVFEVTARALAAAFDKIAMARPRVIRLAQDDDGLWVTYVQRSKLMRYPDYISVRFVDLEGGKSTLAVFSRSRFGKSDSGVNKARVTSWVAALGQAL